MSGVQWGPGGGGGCVMHSNAAGCAVSMAPGAGGKLSKPADVPLACEPPSACLPALQVHGRQLLHWRRFPQVAGVSLPAAGAGAGSARQARAQACCQDWPAGWQLAAAPGRVLTALRRVASAPSHARRGFTSCAAGLMRRSMRTPTRCSSRPWRSRALHPASPSLWWVLPSAPALRLSLEGPCPACCSHCPGYTHTPQAANRGASPDCCLERHP